ncbi:hypothetical protein CGCF413_v013979 [Colletotrichum fructicola]|nr:hypothetical protein CGCF413_v013979 [Colletotrichum fructicola]
MTIELKAHVPAVTYHLSSVRVIRVHFCTSFCQEQRSCLCSTRSRNGHSQAGTDEELDRSPVSAGSFDGLNAAVNVDLSVGPALVRLSLEHYQWNFGVWPWDLTGFQTVTGLSFLNRSRQGLCLKAASQP